MKWIISILVFFILFIFFFLVVPILIGTRSIAEPEDIYSKTGFKYCVSYEECKAKLTAIE